MPDQKSLTDICLELGANAASLVPVEKIPFDKTLRAYCASNACGNYGRNYACPPGVGQPEEVIERAKSYSNALLFQTIGQIEDSFDLEGMDSAAVVHSKVCADIFDAIAPQMGRRLLLTAGECRLCPKCAQIDGKPCRCPEKALSSLEAYCMNVSALCGRCGMNYINGENTVTYFGMCLFD